MAEDSPDNEDGNDSEDDDGDEARTTEPRTAHRASGVTTSRGASARFVRVSERIYIHGDKEP